MTWWRWRGMVDRWMRMWLFGQRGRVWAACLAAAFWASDVEAQVTWRSGVSQRSERSAAEVVDFLCGSTEAGVGRHVVVQFDGPLSRSARAKLRDAGVRLTASLGGNAYFAAIRAGGADRIVLDRVAGLVDGLAVEPAWKTHAFLLRATAPGWLVVDVVGDRVPVYVLFHGDVDAATAQRVLARHAVAVRSRLRGVNAVVVEMPFAGIANLAAEDAVQYIEPALPAFAGVNDSNRAITEADIVQAAPYGLDGSGVGVLVYDAGTARATHVDFEGRLTARDVSGLSDHSTHVSGTIGGGGVGNPLYVGMAPGVTIESYGFEVVGGLQPGFLYTDPGDLETDYGEAINLFGVAIANNSIGTNTAPNGFPCDWEGDYGITSALIDSIVGGSLGAPFRIVWANGNERASGRCGTTYHTTAPPACAKNHITVGALNSNDDSVTYFTSWGPTDDGRLKPDVSAPGCQIGSDGGVTSSSGSGDSAYTTFCGTSMAAPTVTGLLALLLQDYRAQNPGAEDPLNSTLKAMLAHNAEDIAAPGPDYESGYGSVRIRRTVDFLSSDSFFEDSVDQGGTVTASVVVGAQDAELKVTIAWDDVPGTPNVVPSLVNDLDLRVFDPSGDQHFPWTLGGLADPSAPAERTVSDHVNNIEQVLVANPSAGVWTVEIAGFDVPQGPQSFSVCITPVYSPDCNDNGIDDTVDIQSGTSEDCNGNTVPDECEPLADCNANGTQDICDIADGSSGDVNANQIPDSCEADCNGNGTPDDYDIETGISPDCNANGVPDSCDLADGTSGDCGGNGIPDECELDCNANGASDDCDIADGTSDDCDANGVPDECEIDCNGNGIGDECDIVSGTSIDANGNGFPDECVRLYVNESALGGGTGWSWADAQPELRTALAQATQNSDIREVWVAAGRYAPAESGGDRNATFALRDGLKLYGGFSGGEANALQRDWVTHVTTLTGDLNGDDEPNWGNSVDNSRHVVTGVNLGADTLLDGFNIVNGYSTNGGGAGVRLTNALVTVANCAISGNLSAFASGGGVMVSDGHPRFVNCSFLGDYVHMGKGGAMFIFGLGGVTVEGCSFQYNTSVGSTSGSPEAAGAAIAHWGADELIVIDSSFTGNVSRGFFVLGDNGAYSGAIDHFGAGRMTIDRCVFTNNRSNEGGAVFSWRDATITNSVFAFNHAPSFNSTFGWGGQGGAVASSSFSGSTVDVANCVFYGNTAEGAGGVGGFGASNVTVRNSVLWNNTDNRGSIGASQVSGATISHCCIMNMLVAEPGEDPPNPASFPGSTAEDPLFADGAGGDFHVLAGSPCIDAGDNAALSADTIRDLDGQYRYLDDPMSPDVGSGEAPLVDMGAYERGSVDSGDYNGDGYVDLFDYGVFADCFTGPIGIGAGSGCAPFDFDGDDDVDMADLAQLQVLFDGGEPPLDPPATISGTVAYGGAENGTIVVRATGIGATTAEYETSMALPGLFQLVVDRAGAYEVSAFLDVNGNQTPDVNEPYVAYGLNPVVVATAGQSIDFVDLSLGGANAILGRIVWSGGGGGFNIAVELGGTAVDSATTDGNGDYDFAALSDGTYTVTPVSGARYFYPFDYTVTLSGNDATGLDFVMHTLPGGDVNGEVAGVVSAVDAANYNLTVDTGSGLVTLFAYSGTVFSGDANSLEEIMVGWNVMAQYYTSGNLAVEIDVDSGQ